ncbi:OmpA family protein [Myroides injenensis]|uniref:OmpA family protein n=1 Tax=Myroides injenensis TaxID=1183151 RepID=UPI000288996F|nr:OmpA family protein [Myroides injenensis]
MRKLYLGIIGALLSIGSVSAQKIEGRVFDKDTNSPIVEGEVTFYNVDGGRIATVYTQKDGGYSFEPADLSNVHKVVGSANDYNKAEVLVNQMDLGIIANFGLIHSKNKTKSYTLKENGETKLVSSNKESNLPFFYYDFNSSYLTDSNKRVVDEIVNFMHANPEAKVRVHVYFDSRGNAKYDEWLAERRANRVVEYLVMKGIAPSRLMKWVETVNSNVPPRAGSYAQSPGGESRRCDFDLI